MELENYLNCCSNPYLKRVKTLYEKSHDCEWLDQCINCKSYWFHRFHEYVDYHEGNDDITEWFTLLKNEEAKEIIESKERPILQFLEKRESIMVDESGIKVVKGQPTFPWS